MAGADADPLIHEYDAAHSGIRQASAAEIFEAAARISLRGRRPPNWSAAMALVIAAVVIYGIAHAFGSPSRQVNAAAHRKTVPVPMPRLPAGPPPRPRRASSTGPCWFSSQPTEGCWVGVYAAGGTLKWQAYIPAEAARSWHFGHRVS